jgi:hypothetical protein
VSSYASPTETLVSTQASKWTLEVNASGTGTPDWVKVRGISDMSTSVDSNTEDDSDYDSDGWASTTKTQMSWSLDVTVMRKIGFTTRNYDEGQEILRAAADEFGVDGSVQVRWYDRTGGPEAYTGTGSVSYAPQGGKTTDLDSAKVTIDGQGARTKIANPNAGGAGADAGA